KTQNEAAREIGCPLGTVAWRVAQAKEFLRKYWGRLGAAVSVGAADSSQDAAQAVLSEGLLQSTVSAVMRDVAGQPVDPFCSAQVAELTKAVLAGMGTATWKIPSAAALILATTLAAVVAGGAAWWWCQQQGEPAAQTAPGLNRPGPEVVR